MAHNLEGLFTHIVSLSQSSDFNEAKKEWTLFDVEISDDWDECPCGQSIKEICIIKNNINSKLTHVGNVCINQFMGIDTGNLFDGLKRISKDTTANANADVITHAHQLGYIYEKEYDFLMQIKNKRKLSIKQASWKEKINKRILNAVVVYRPDINDPDPAGIAEILTDKQRLTLSRDYRGTTDGAYRFALTDDFTAYAIVNRINGRVTIDVGVISVLNSDRTINFDAKEMADFTDKYTHLRRIGTSKDKK